MLNWLNGLNRLQTKCLWVRVQLQSLKGFKFQLNVCNGCRDLLMMSINPSDIAILNIEGSDYCCIISGSSKSEPINLLQNIDLTQKSGTL